MLTITSDVVIVRRCVKQLIKKITTDVFFARALAVVSVKSCPCSQPRLDTVLVTWNPSKLQLM